MQAKVKLCEEWLMKPLVHEFRVRRRNNVLYLKGADEASEVTEAGSRPECPRYKDDLTKVAYTKVRDPDRNEQSKNHW